MHEFTVLTQSYHQKELVEILIKSFERYKPDNFLVKYVIVEGSDDVSYKENIKSITDRVAWFNNSSADLKDPISGASTANGLNIEFGKQHANTGWVFVCHNDVAVVSSKFYHMFEQYSKTHDVFSMCRDNSRINACHISGLFVKSEILKQVDCMPALPDLDVGDRLTSFCRNNEISYTSLPNTHNTPEIWNRLSGKWHAIGKDAGVDRCVYDNEVIFVHLGRGTPKFLNAYNKSGKVTYLDWKFLHKEYLDE